MADGDLINRTELLKAIDTWDKFGCDADTRLIPVKDCYVPYIHYDDVVKCIKGMPSVAIPQEHDGCKDCKHQDKGEDQMPCLECQHNYKDKWEKKPHWIDDNENELDAQYGRHLYKCSECNTYANDHVGGTEDWWDIKKPNYCPRCGAKMD